jgi:enoyl-CoA hydratase/carnithine racemase
VGVIVYTGAGADAFCTGGDVKEYEEEYLTRPRDYWKYMGLFRAYIESIVNSGKPVVARLNGMAVGGGNESQMACDLAVMAEHAWIGQVGTRVGSVAAGGATQWLPLMIGDRRAREMLLFNGRIPAYQALEWGLVNRVVPSVTRDGVFVERATEEEIRKAQKGRDGYAIDLSRLDEAVAEMAQQAPAAVPGVRTLHQAAGELLEGALLAPDDRPRPRLAGAALHQLRAVGGDARLRAEAPRRATTTCAGSRRRAAPASSCGDPTPWTAPPAGRRGSPPSFAYCGACGAALDGGADGERRSGRGAAPRGRRAGAGGDGRPRRRRSPEPRRRGGPAPVVRVEPRRAPSPTWCWTGRRSTC